MLGTNAILKPLHLRDDSNIPRKEEKRKAQSMFQPCALSLLSVAKYLTVPSSYTWKQITSEKFTCLKLNYDGSNSGMVWEKQHH